MASTSNQERKKDKDSFRTSGLSVEDTESKRQLLSASTSATSKQNGDQAGCEDEQMSELDASERRRSGPTVLKNCSSSPTTIHRSTDELPRRSFQIPRKTKERKGLIQLLPPKSREFEEIVKLLSSFYLDSSSGGAFIYTKACLIHNELLEKEFIEKKRELKQAGRTDADLTESYGFLLPDRNKVHWICEKGLSVGHARMNTLGNPVKGVYLSRYSDLLQVNPLEAGSSGDIILFKLMKGRQKGTHENMPKNELEPTSKFDCHVSKNACKVTSLLSYRGFERTQQYFYEFAFEELRPRPRHVCPYAVVSFQYKGKDPSAGPHRINSTVYEGPRARRKYTVWSGMLVNNGEELFHVSIRSSKLPFLPFKLPEKLDVNMAMHIEQVKRKIPPALLSWDTYSRGCEVLRCGLYCSLFEVMGRNRPTSSLAGLLQKLEKEKIVLVKPLVDRGFLFLMSSAHLHSSYERRGRMDRGLQALFVFREPRMVSRCAPKPEEDSLASTEPKDPNIRHIDAFLPALHHALLKMRSTPSKDLAAGVKRQALDYLALQEQGVGRPFVLPEYRQTLEERGGPQAPIRPKHIDSLLNSYFFGPGTFQLPVQKMQGAGAGAGAAAATTDGAVGAIGASPPAGGCEDYSPVSDWGGAERQAPAVGWVGVAQSNGGAQGAHLPHGEYDKEKMEKLLRLIHMRKRTLGKEEGGLEREEDWEPAGLKRRLAGEGAGSTSKYLRSDAPYNGALGRVPGVELQEESQSLSLSMVMDSMGLCGTDLRAQLSQGSASVSETQRLLKLFLSTLNRMAHGANAVAALKGELSDCLGTDVAVAIGDRDLRAQPAGEEQATQDYLEDQTACSTSSMDICSPSSSIEPQSSRPGEAAGPRCTPWAMPVTEPASGCVADGRGAERGGSIAPGAERHRCTAGKAVDAILTEEFHSLCTEIQGLMDSQQITHVSEPPPEPLDNGLHRLHAAFSPFVSNYVSSLPVQAYVNTLCEGMNRLIYEPAGVRAPAQVLTHGPPPSPGTMLGTTPSLFSPSPASGPPVPAALSPVPAMAAPAPSSHLAAPLPVLGPPAAPTLSSPPAPCHPSVSPGTLALTAKPTNPKTAKPQGPSIAPAPGPIPQPAPHSKPRLGTVREIHLAAAAGNAGDKPKDGKLADFVDSPSFLSPSGLCGFPPIPDPPTPPHMAAAISSTMGNHVIGHLKPDVLYTLVEIMQMNAVKFYIQLGDEGQSQLSAEITDYLKSLGNIECNPQRYLENNSQQKFMIIIQNEDIATHVHKIPALVSLKKFSTVYFAGVDSLDDVKNRTYNELFVSGGLIVSDEFVLNPDVITHNKLQAFLKFLEEQSSPWKWKVHCKTQKKLKELSRLNSEALDLLNLLTAYQKKHLVEFLPYHECDAPSRQAPDLDCLVRLQAQHTQQRHILLLTESHVPMPAQFSSHGIMSASMDEIINNLHGLISSTGNAEVPVLPVPPDLPAKVEEEEQQEQKEEEEQQQEEEEECGQEEDMSLDSEDDTLAIAEPALPTQDRLTECTAPQPPPPQLEEFQPPLPERPALDTLPASSPAPFPTQNPYLEDVGGVARFGGPRQENVPPSKTEDPLANFGVNPHQSYLCPSASQWSPYSGSPAYAIPALYPPPGCPGARGREYPLQPPGQYLPRPPSSDGQPAPDAVPSHQLPGQALPLCEDSGALVAAVGSSVGGVNQLAPPGSQDEQAAAMECAHLPSPSQSGLSYTDSAPGSMPPVPAVLAGYIWGPGVGCQQGYAVGVGVGGLSGVSSTPSEGAGTLGASAASADMMWGVGSECGTPNSQGGGSTPVASTPGAPGGVGGGERSSTSGSLTPSSQGSRTPVRPTEGQVAGGAPQAPNRGLLPLPGATLGALCRSTVAALSSHSNSIGYGPRPVEGPMRGGYRGRGIPPAPMRSRPGRGQIRGGSASWAYPIGRGGVGGDYYSDHPYP